MKKFIFLVFALLAVFFIKIQAQEGTSYKKETYQFASRENQDLFLDRYYPIVSQEKNPCVIFVFGGAFARGARDVEKYIPYFDYLVQNGYTVVSIDYRLGLKNIGEEKDLNEEKFIGIFMNTLTIAVEDLFDATNYILQRAGEWNIDTNCIIANGSSAGAVTVLQAEHAITSGTYTSGTLPAGFNYAGIIAFAGAIFTLEGGIEWLNVPCPIMMFHGDADLQVPYDKLTYGPVGFYGANHISETLDRMNYPYYFYKFENYGHEIASDPMQQNKEDILWFMNTLVKEKQQLKILKHQRQIGRPEMQKDFEFEDYIRGNFVR